MTSYPPGPQGDQDPNKTTVFPAGGFGVPAPPAGHGATPGASGQPGQPAWGAPPPPPPPPAAQPQGYGGAQQYGQSNYSPSVSQYQQPSVRRQAFNPVGAGLIIVGAILGVLAFTAFNWFSDKVGDVSGGGSKFSKVHDLLNQVDVPGASQYIDLGTLSKPYFSWLAWVLLAAAVVIGLAAVSPVGAGAPALRAVGVVVGLAGLGATLWAIDLFSIKQSIPGADLSGTPNSYTDFLKHTSIGAWAAGAAFLLIAIGAAAGPNRKGT